MEKRFSVEVETPPAEGCILELFRLDDGFVGVAEAGPSDDSRHPFWHAGLGGAIVFVEGHAEAAFVRLPALVPIGVVESGRALPLEGGVSTSTEKRFSTPATNSKTP